MFYVQSTGRNWLIHFNNLIINQHAHLHFVVELHAFTFTYTSKYTCVSSLTFNHKEFMLLNKLSGRGTKTVSMETERIVLLLTKARKWTCPSRI